MNYMPYANDVTYPEPDCQSDRRLYLNYDKKRPGRDLADLHLQDVSPFMILAVKWMGRTYDVTFASDPLPGLFMGWEWGGWAPHGVLTHGSLVESIPAVAEDDADAQLVEPLMASLVVKEMTTGPAHEAEDDFTADEWAKLGEEVGLAKQGLLAADVKPIAATAVEMQTDGPEPMIRLGALSMGGNPMRPRRRAV
jgi:hypothetical protein